MYSITINVSKNTTATIEHTREGKLVNVFVEKKLITSYFSGKTLEDIALELCLTEFN